MSTDRHDLEHPVREMEQDWLRQDLDRLKDCIDFESGVVFGHCHLPYRRRLRFVEHGMCTGGIVMSRTKSLTATAAAIALLAALSGSPALAGDVLPTTTIVRKTVVGPADSGSTVVVACNWVDDGEPVALETTLNYDSAGAPTTVSGDSADSWAPIDGAWQAMFPLLFERSTCTYLETDTGGAVSTAWTCDYEAVLGTAGDGLGCAAASGDGVGPATVVSAEQNDELISQVTTVEFTNTYEASTTTAGPAPTTAPAVAATAAQATPRYTG